MKVVFFGQTFDGKSSFNNALLHDKVLKSGIGHTTHCFCQIERVDGLEHYVTIERSEEKFDAVKVEHLPRSFYMRRKTM